MEIYVSTPVLFVAVFVMGVIVGVLGLMVLAIYQGSKRPAGRK